MIVQAEVDKLMAYLKEAGECAVLKTASEAEVSLKADDVISFFTQLKNNFSFEILLDITAVDWQDDSFEVVYHLLSLNNSFRLVCKTLLKGENPKIDSLSSLWQSAVFLEREVFDMFGIVFTGHPDLRRILMYDEFEGYPLRKDYPIKKKQPRVPLLFPENDPSSCVMSRPELSEIKKRRDGEKGGEVKFVPVPERLADNVTHGLSNKLSGHTLSDELHSESRVISLGPSHPATHGTIRITAEVVGEKIKNADVELGYLHRGFEKTAEAVTYTQVIPYTDRLNYVSPLINNVGWCLSIEKLLGIEVPKRNQYIRVLISEISRVCDHLTCIGASAMELGAFTVMLYLMQAREYLWDLVEEVSGARLTASYVRIGSLLHDLPDGFTEKMKTAFVKVRKLVSMVDRLLSQNRIFKDRMCGIAEISREEALSYGLTGPLLRASGVNYDVRKAFPYSSYEDFDFEIPLGENGDNYDRYLVRLREIEQSIRIAEQAAENLPAGEISVNDPRIVLPKKSTAANSIEGMIAHFKLITDGIQPPKGDIYLPVEGGNGELAFYTVSDGTGHPYRVHVRAPSFVAMGIFKKLIVGIDIADIIATFGMMNMIGGECDR